MLVPLWGYSPQWTRRTPRWTPPWTRRSDGGPPSVGFERVAGHERGRVRAEPDNGLRDLIGLAEAAHRRPPPHLLEQLFVTADEAAQHRGADRSRADRVHADAVTGDLERRRLREPEHTVLARRVRGEPWHAHLAGG